MRRLPSEKLQVHIVWIPMLRSDDREAALEGSAEFQNDRVSYYWDSDKAIGGDLKKTLGLWQTAWDVYLLYRPGTMWHEQSPLPDYWMHQLSMANAKGTYLDVDSLTSATENLLGPLLE